MVGVVKSFPGGIEAVNYLSRDYHWVGPILNPWHIWEIRTSWVIIWMNTSWTYVYCWIRWWKMFMISSLNVF